MRGVGRRQTMANVGPSTKSVGLEAVRPGVPLAVQEDTPKAKKAGKFSLDDPHLDEKMRAVKELLVSDGLCPLHLVQGEVLYYFKDLGLDESYFKLETKDIANHVLTLYSAKAFSKLSDTPFQIDVRRELESRALYICNSTATLSEEEQILPPSYEIERRIEVRYLMEDMSWESLSSAAADNAQKSASVLNKMVKSKQKTLSMLRLGKPKQPKQGSSVAVDAAEEVVATSGRPLYRIQCYRTTNVVSDSIDLYLWFFFVQKASFLANPPALRSDEVVIKEAPKLNTIGNTEMLSELSSDMRILYDQMIAQASKALGPVIETVDVGNGVHRVVVCYRTGNSEGYYSTLTNIVKTHKVQYVKKELEPLYGYNIVSLYLQPTPEQTNWKKHVLEDMSLLYCVPVTEYSYLFHFGQLTAFEVTYCYCAQLFIFYFCGHQTALEEANYKYLEDRLTEDSAVSRLHTIIRAQQLTTWSETRIRESIVRNKHLIKDLYKHFETYAGPSQRASFASPISDEDILAKIKLVSDEFDQQVLTACLSFNNSINKTNMWKKTKSSLVFDVDPACACKDKRRYPVKPFCILLIVGSDFRGFHVRFNEVARGGVRLIRSRSEAEWQRNRNELFFENYSLALTQQKKNKDIPEGGSKGTILTRVGQQNIHAPFTRYMDAILDFISGDSEMIPARVNKQKGDEDMIFIGPDENTADVMDWAALYARERKLSIWKAFTTGKSARIGGIPHDVYGMTTRSVHQYVLGTLEKLGLKEEEMTKCQTGGPDGDLGSNEILISKDKTVAIIDGSGVLYDPAGLDRTELVRLAKARKMVKFFDKKFLSKKGFLVLCEQKGVTLPDGSVVEDGEKFRNTFHLHPLFTADMFVPCGGRPAAVNMGNIDQFARVQTETSGLKERFKIIVEGANLFLTQDARLVLERQGVTLFKDASANKGGVTSSSCEVLSALCLNDEEFSKNMCTTDAGTPDFYNKYAGQVQAKIESNARREFECLWMEKQRTGTPFSLLGDTLSAKINDLGSSIRASPLLYDDVNLRNKVLSRAVPPLLITFVDGVDNFVQRVPDAYVRWIFAAYLSSDYVYSNGLNTTEFTFMTYIDGLRK